MHGPKSRGAAGERGNKKKRDTATQERGGRTAGGAGEAGGGGSSSRRPQSTKGLVQPGVPTGQLPKPGFNQE
eukprot:4847502-Pyramimonas_sp.AAC.1